MTFHGSMLAKASRTTLHVCVTREPFETARNSSGGLEVNAPAEGWSAGARRQVGRAQTNGSPTDVLIHWITWKSIKRLIQILTDGNSATLVITGNKLQKRCRRLQHLVLVHAWTSRNTFIRK